MNILIINHYGGAPSLGMEYRHYYLAKEWLRRGHNVLIVCASNTHLRSKQFILKNKFEKHFIDDINYFVIKAPDYSKNDLKRLYNILMFIWRLDKYSNKLLDEFKPDIVISSSTFLFDIYSAKKITKASQAKLIFEVKDLWPLALIEYGGYSKWHPFIILMQLAENYAYKHSDMVVSLLPKSLEYMVEHGLASEKFTYIPNGISSEDWTDDEDIPSEIIELVNSIKVQNKKIVGYAGNHGIANALYSLIDAMKILEAENVVLFLIGKGQEKNNLIKYVKKLGFSNVHFIQALPKTIIPSLFNKIDYLYIGLQNQPLFRFGISPNKLMDYMMAGKPIIQAIKAGNDIVTEAKCGITIEPENPEAIVRAVKYFISKSDDELKIMGENGRKYCLNHHDYKVLAQKYLEAIETIQS